MYLFDTDHLGFLQFQNSSEFQNLSVRLEQHSPDQFFISIHRNRESDDIVDAQHS